MCEEKKSGGCSTKWLHTASLIFRAAGIVLAVAAAGVLATASQCTVYADYGARPLTITYTDFPVFVYLMAASTIAALLQAAALFLAAVSKKCKSKKGSCWKKVLTALLAAVVPALLYTAVGAAFAAGGDIYYYMGPAGGRRFSVCRSVVGGSFCERLHVSMWLALGAAAAVSIAECLSMLRWGHGGGPCSDICSDSDSDSEAVCGHGCHCKH